ncbi:unnamed protein product, partial [Protopolystoma xenopodis]
MNDKSSTSTSGCIHNDSAEPNLDEPFSHGSSFSFPTSTIRVDGRELPEDLRIWRPSEYADIATLSLDDVYRMPICGHSATANNDKEAQSNLASIGNGLEGVLHKVETTFSSLACLSTLCLVDNLINFFTIITYIIHFVSENHSHFHTGRNEIGMELDMAFQLQNELFRRLPPTDIRRIINLLIDNVLSKARTNYPGLDCLRAFAFLAVSPLLDTPRFPNLSTKVTSSGSSTNSAHNNGTATDSVSENAGLDLAASGTPYGKQTGG